MDLRVLGAIEVGDDPASLVPLRGRLQRLLLALLARRAESWTSVDALVQALWPDDPDPRADTRVHVHVHRLRRRLGQDAIEHSASGYRLTLPTDAVDAWHFEALVGAALAGHVDLDEDGALLAALERGLTLWRGAPFADIDHPLLATARHRLTEIYLLGQETRWQRRLDRGEHERALEPLASLSRDFPLRERLQALWMTALHRSGETALALQVYQGVRTRVVEELGIEPGSELRGVHELVLADSAAGPAQGNESPDAAAPAGPALVPAPSGPILGRSTQLAALDRALRDTRSRTGTRLVQLTGPGGVGKTELICTWAARRRHAYPGGRLYAKLGDVGATSAADLLEYLLLALGVPADRIRTSIRERAAQLRSQLSGRRTLVVLDDVTDAEQVLPLLSRYGSTDVVAISHRPLPGLVDAPGAVPIELPPLDAAGARQLLRHRLEAAAGMPDGELDRIAHRAGHLPLAIVVAAEQLSRADVARATDPVSAAYDDLDPDAATVLRRLSVLTSHPVEPATADAAADMDTARSGVALECLVRDRFLSRDDGGRYRMHDKVRAVAARHADLDDGPHEQERTVARVLDRLLDAAPRPDQPFQPWLRDDGAAAVELATRLGAAGAGRRRRLADDVVPRLTHEGRYALAERVLRAALADAPEPAADARWRRELGLVLSTLGRQREALDLQAQAEVLLRQRGDAQAHAELLTDMCVVAAVTGDLQRSIRLLDEAREVTAAAGGSEAVVQVVRALVLVLMYRLDDAATILDSLGQAPDLDPERHVTWLRARSQLHRRRREFPQAIAIAEESVDQAQTHRSHRQLGLTGVDLASSLRDAGDRAALRRYQEVLQHATGAGRDPLAAMTHAAIAAAWLRWDDPGRATAHGREALQIAERCESWGFAARASVRLADAADALGEPMRASWYRHTGLAYYRRVDYPLPRSKRDRLTAQLRPV